MEVSRMISKTHKCFLLSAPPYPVECACPVYHIPCSFSHPTRVTNASLLPFTRVDGGKCSLTLFELREILPVTVVRARVPRVRQPFITQSVRDVHNLQSVLVLVLVLVHSLQPVLPAPSFPLVTSDTCGLPSRTAPMHPAPGLAPVLRAFDRGFSLHSPYPPAFRTISSPEPQGSSPLRVVGFPRLCMRLSVREDQ